MELLGALLSRQQARRSLSSMVLARPIEKRKGSWSPLSFRNIFDVAVVLRQGSQQSEERSALYSGLLKSIGRGALQLDSPAMTTLRSTPSSR